MKTNPGQDWPENATYYQHCNHCGENYIGPKRSPYCWTCKPRGEIRSGLPHGKAGPLIQGPLDDISADGSMGFILGKWVILIPSMKRDA